MKTILLIDDDELLRELFGGALRRKGYYVIEADSGVEGFEKARQNLPDLILTDICMPGGDGETLLHNIRDDPELKTSQVIVMSGMPDLLVPRTGTEEGANDFLTKPVSLKVLLSCVQARFIQAALCCHVLAQRQVESVDEADRLLHAIPVGPDNLPAFDLMPIGPLLPLGMLIKAK
jgi:CheY-like chemotaxis protein